MAIGASAVIVTTNTRTRCSATVSTVVMSNVDTPMGETDVMFSNPTARSAAGAKTLESNSDPGCLRLGQVFAIERRQPHGRQRVTPLRGPSAGTAALRVKRRRRR